MQAFVVNGIDFEEGAKHTCFLALKDSTYKDSIIYTADLIIVNTKRHKIVSETAKLEDLTIPVPPFTKYSKNQFGLLNNISIN